jgi:gliding motility-associated-like protein
MTKKITLLLAFSIILPALFFGQGETSNWYFGNNAGIRFNNDGTVTALSDGRLDTFEGCTTISDALGDLLFYTDGIVVYDRNHNIMQNGSGLHGDPSSTQSALIVPKPLDPNIYYVFTVDTSTSEDDPDFGLNYSIIDIRLNNGNGAITQKNINLLNDCSEKIAAVIKDCSDKTIWVVTFSSQLGSGSFDTYHAFEISTSGVSTNAVKSTFSHLSVDDPRGYLKFSNDGKKMASANMRFGLQIFDFNPMTGVVSNLQRLGINGANKESYGVEFSPNNRFLYTHSSNIVEGELKHSSSLIQFDLEALDITASQVEIDYSKIYRGALQLGANGKIYRTISLDYSTGTPFLGVINNPNQKGVAANYQHNAIALGNNSTQGLPPFIQSFFNKTDLILNADGTSSGSTTICEGESFTLEAEEIVGAIYNWEKDGNPVANPDNHLFHIDNAEHIDSGRYSLEIVPPDSTECKILAESLIEVLDIPIRHNLSLVQCDIDIDDTQDGITDFNLQQAKGNSENEYLFYESMVDRDNDNPLEDEVLYRNVQPFNQTLFFKEINEGGCENYGELELQVNTVTLTNNNQNHLYACDENPNDTILSATFDLKGAVQMNYPNSTVEFYGSLNDVVMEQNPLTDNFTTESKTVYARFENSNECQDVLKIELIVNPTPIFELSDVFEICSDNPLLMINGPEGFDSYHWTKNDGMVPQTISNSQIVSISDIGDYSLEVGYVYNNGLESVACTNISAFEVVPSNRAVINKVVVQDFSSNNTVLIEASGDGDYEYSLDGINYVDSNFFESVAPGIFTLHIRDKKGCGVVKQSISVMGYPKFFTPNGDGINDYWSLIGLSKDLQANSSVSIFDRYGAFLTHIEPTSRGWDGVLNGKFLPSSDYWFKASLEDGRVFKGHFALKR